MRTTCNLFAGIVMAVLGVSCTSEEAVSELSGGSQSVFNMYVNNVDTGTRTTIDGSGIVRWLTTDRINVNGVVNTETDITWNGGTETRFGFDTAPIPENGNYYAVYPAVIADGTRNVYQPNSKGKFTIKMPQEQPCNEEGGTFANNVNLSVASGNTTRLFFTNVCGIAKISLKKGNIVEPMTGIKKVRFISNPGKPVSGTGVVDVVTKKLTLNAGESESVDVVFSTPQSITSSTPLSVSLCLPVTSYEAGWAIQLFDEGGLMRFEAVSEAPLTIQRNRITNASIRSFNKVKSYQILYDANGGNVATVPGAQVKLPGVDITLSSTVPVRDGYRFRGWAFADNINSVVFKAGQANITDIDLGNPTGDVIVITLYAVWGLPDIVEPGLAAPRLYVMGTGTSAQLFLTQSPTNYGTLFQSGSVIAWNYGNTGEANYNPSISGSSSWDVSWFSDGQHTLDNLKIGKGDPCRLVGMTISEIQTDLNSGRTPDNKRWRLPTDAESQAMYTKYSLLTIEGIVGSNFPNSPLGTFLPAAGIRLGGVYSERELTGQYWSNDFSPKVLYISINYQAAFPSWTFNRAGGSSVRCVKQ